jgi:hypothetical protein
MYSPLFFCDFVRGLALLPMTAASSADGVSGLLKPVAAPVFFAAVADLVHWLPVFSPLVKHWPGVDAADSQMRSWSTEHDDAVPARICLRNGPGQVRP